MKTPTLLTFAAFALIGCLLVSAPAVFADEPLAPTSVAPAATPALTEEALPSPYFVDEVHCEGIRVHSASEGWLLSKDEVEAAKKVESEETCENLLKTFGITKYMWLSPSDLERVSTIMRQSEYFEGVELSIKKSELKNHVHIFAKVKPKPRWLKSLAEEFKFYGAANQGSSRIYDKLQGEVTDRAFAPHTMNTLGVSLEGSGASSPINIDSSQVTADDLQKLQSRNYYLADLYWKFQGQFSPHVAFDLGMDLTTDNVYADGVVRANFLMNADLLLTHRVNLLRGNTFFGPSALFTTVTPYQGGNSTSVILPGFIVGYKYGYEFGNNLGFKFGYYHSTGDSMVLDYKLGAQYRLPIADLLLVGHFDWRMIQDAVLPQDRFPLSGAESNDLFGGLSKVFTDGVTNQQITLGAGGEYLNYAGQSLASYSADTPYIGLKYKLAGHEWNLNLSAGYYFQRTY